MSLDCIMSQHETKAEKLTNNLPWYVRLLFSSELTEIRDIVKQSKGLREHYQNYQENPEWYIKQGKLITQSRDLAVNTANKAYDYYRSLKSIPLIGDYISDYLSKSISKRSNGLLKKVPSRQGLLKLINTGYDHTMALYSNLAESNTDNGFDYYYQRLNKPIEKRNYNTGFYKVFTSAINGMSNFVKYVSNYFNKNKPT